MNLCRKGGRFASCSTRGAVSVFAPCSTPTTPAAVGGEAHVTLLGEGPDRGTWAVVDASGARIGTPYRVGRATSDRPPAPGYPVLLPDVEAVVKAVVHTYEEAERRAGRPPMDRELIPVVHGRQRRTLGSVLLRPGFLPSAYPVMLAPLLPEAALIPLPPAVNAGIFAADRSPILAERQAERWQAYRDQVGQALTQAGPQAQGASRAYLRTIDGAVAAFQAVARARRRSPTGNPRAAIMKALEYQVHPPADPWRAYLRTGMISRVLTQRRLDGEEAGELP